MNKKSMSGIAAAFFALQLVALPVHASDAQDSRNAKSAKPAQQERIYGSHLMTREERAEHREKLRNAKDRQERQQIRKEHHDKMKERAKERGVTLPDEPPAKSKGSRGAAGGPSGGNAPGGAGPGGMGPGGMGGGPGPGGPGR